jgi:hypothetical protein
VSGRGLRAAMPAAIVAGLIAFALVALSAQLIPIVIDVFGGGLVVSTALKLGWLYELAFHRVGIELSGTGGESGGMAVAFLTGTALALWVLFRAGRAVADRAGTGVRDRLLAGAAVGPVYALPIVVGTTLVRLRLATGGVLVPGTMQLRGVVWQAFVFPALLGIVAGGAGGSVDVLGSRARAWLVGGWRGLVCALGLAVVGILVLAAARPQGSAEYARVVSANGPRVALLLLGHHALLLPDQSFLVLAPSMGGCTRLAGSSGTIPWLCPGHLPVLSSAAVLDDIARVGGVSTTSSGSNPTRTMPAGYAAFILVPALATLAAGWYAGAGTSEPFGLHEALARGTGAGVVFAVLVGVGSWMAGVSLTLHASDGSVITGLTLGPRPAPTALLAFVWGVAGGMLGASIRRQDGGTPEPVAPDEPAVPPNPTSV